MDKLLYKYLETYYSIAAYDFYNKDGEWVPKFEIIADIITVFTDQKWPRYSKFSFIKDEWFIKVFNEWVKDNMPENTMNYVRMII